MKRRRAPRQKDKVMRNRKRTKPSTSPSEIIAVAVAAVVVLAGLGLAVVVGRDGGGSSLDDSGGADQVVVADGKVELPAYVMAAPLRVQEAYRFVAERPDVMAWMPCYCGCGDHNGHKSARNCFVQDGSTQSEIQFDTHGVGCAMCVGIALDAKAMTEDGLTLSAIRNYIDSEYGSIGPGTDTPLPGA
jgi:hypothetical protein